MNLITLEVYDNPYIEESIPTEFGVESNLKLDFTNKDLITMHFAKSFDSIYTIETIDQDYTAFRIGPFEYLSELPIHKVIEKFKELNKSNIDESEIS